FRAAAYAFKLTALPSVRAVVRATLQRLPVVQPFRPRSRPLKQDGLSVQSLGLSVQSLVRAVLLPAVVLPPAALCCYTGGPAPPKIPRNFQMPPCSPTLRYSEITHSSLHN